MVIGVSASSAKVPRHLQSAGPAPLAGEQQAMAVEATASRAPA